MKNLRLYFLTAISIVTFLIASRLRAKSDEPSPEPIQPLSRLMAWDAFEESITKTFHAECRGLCFGALDAVYILPSTDALARVEKFQRRYSDGGPYVDEAKDCDDFAREATYLAKRWSYRHFPGLPATLAYGSAFVRIDGLYSLFSSNPEWMTGYHVLNIYLRSDGQWFFVEPQTGKSERVESMLYEGVIEVLRLDI